MSHYLRRPVINQIIYNIVPFHSQVRAAPYQAVIVGQDFSVPEKRLTPNIKCNVVSFSCAMANSCSDIDLAHFFSWLLVASGLGNV